MKPADDTTLRAYFLTHPGALPTMRELLRAGCGTSTSTLTRQCERLVATGFLVDFGARRARRFRLAEADEVQPARDTQNLLDIARLLLERTEQRGGFGVVPWAAVEALREAVQG